MSEWINDLRRGGRMLSQRWGFSLLVIVTLAFAVGCNIAIFSFIHGVLLQRLPYADPDRIAQVAEFHEGHAAGVSTMTYLDWRGQNEVFDRIAAHTNSPVTLTGVTEPVQLRSNQVSADFFEVFGIRAALGRTFLPRDDQPAAPRVVVISAGLWQSQFGGDPNILGRSVVLNDEPHEIVGVLPAETAIDRSYHQLWRPLVFGPQNLSRNYHWLGVVARLKPGVTLEQAQANISVIAAKIGVEHPESNRGWGAEVVLFRDRVVGRELRQTLSLLGVAVVVVLVMAAINLANLFLTRGLSRQREVSIRLALGASRWRLVRLYAVEDGLLCVIGSVLGVALGYFLMRAAVVALPAQSLPAEAEIGLHWPVLAFALVLMVVTILVCAFFPVLRTTHGDPAVTLGANTNRATAGAGNLRVKGRLVVAQVALAFALLMSVGLLVRSIAKLQRIDLGFDPDRVISARLPIAQSRFESPEAFSAYLRRITERVANVPGVRDTAVSITLPLQYGGYGMGVQIVGAPMVERSNRPFTFLKPVSPSYFKTLGMNLIRGRALAISDTHSSAPVALVNAAFAQKYFPNLSPLGERVLIAGVQFGKMGLGSDVTWEIVGVVANERVGGLDNDEQEPIVYVTHEQSPQMISQILLLRADFVSAALLQRVREAIHEVNADQVVTELQTLGELKSALLRTRRFQSDLLCAFAAVAVVLAGLGIYGLLSFGVALRTRELGIRSALGASGTRLVGLVLGDGMKLVGVGLVVGVGLSLAAAPLLSGFVYGIAANDPWNFAASAVLLACAATAACYFPARRAAKIDPLICLRSE